jgi:hypothetical protein
VWLPWISAIAVAVVIAGALTRRTILRTVRGEEPIITDEVLRLVLEEGSVEHPDSKDYLDEAQIRQAEDEFWAESWDDPEPWSE